MSLFLCFFLRHLFSQMRCVFSFLSFLCKQFALFILILIYQLLLSVIVFQNRSARRTLLPHFVRYIVCPVLLREKVSGLTSTMILHPKLGMVLILWVLISKLLTSLQKVRYLIVVVLLSWDSVKHALFFKLWLFHLLSLGSWEGSLSALGSKKVVSKFLLEPVCPAFTFWVAENRAFLLVLLFLLGQPCCKWIRSLVKNWLLLLLIKIQGWGLNALSQNLWLIQVNFREVGMLFQVWAIELLWRRFVVF